MTQVYEWSRALNDEWDLSVGDTLVAFIRYRPAVNEYICRFMTFDDDAFPDGKTYRTMRSAKKWCERYAPVVLMRESAGVSDVA
jgi:hypothetical protein